jgi:hypothetical protein
VAVATVTITDRADGTGADADFEHGPPGAANVLFVASVTGQLGILPWTQVATRTGDGPMPVSIAPGYYFWKVESTTGGSVTDCPIVYQNVTDGLAALHSRFLDGVEAQIQLLALPNVAVVRRCGVPQQELVQGPLTVLVTAFLKPETALGGTLQRDDFGYPAYVCLVAPAGAGYDDQEPTLLLNRQKIRRTFSGLRVPGVPEILVCTIEPDPVIDWNPRLENYQFSAMTIRGHGREVRGFGA